MDHTDRRVRYKKAARTPMLIFGITMSIFYIGLGIFLLLDKAFLSYIPSEFRNIFAGLVILYGAYRAWRVYADHYKVR
jgi:hypothetical protein